MQVVCLGGDPSRALGNRDREGKAVSPGGVHEPIPAMGSWGSDLLGPQGDRGLEY